jgi:hypothetical protein
MARLQKAIVAKNKKKPIGVIQNIRQTIGASNPEDEQIEKLIKKVSDLTRPELRQLETDTALQFQSQGKYAIETLVWYLWDNQTIFNLFIEEFVIG